MFQSLLLTHSVVCVVQMLVCSIWDYGWYFVYETTCIPLILVTIQLANTVIVLWFVPLYRKVEVGLAVAFFLSWWQSSRIISTKKQPMTERILWLKRWFPGRLCKTLSTELQYLSFFFYSFWYLKCINVDTINGELLDFFGCCLIDLCLIGSVRFLFKWQL